MPDLIVDVSTTTGTGSCTAVRTADWSGTTRIVKAQDLAILKLFDDSRHTASFIRKLYREFYDASISSHGGD